MEILFLTSNFLRAEKDELDRLIADYPSFKIKTVNQANYTINQIASADIIVGHPKIEDLKKAKNLKWLHLPSSGVASYVYKELYCNQDIIVSRSSGVYGRQIADFVMGYIIYFNNNFILYKEQMQNGVWQGHTPDKNLFDSTILIVGLGDIGKNVAKRAKACEMKVIGIKRDSKEKVANVDSIYNLSSIDELLSQVDFVVLAAARTDETFNLFDEKRLRLMKKDALLINVARGALVDEQALIKILREGHLKGAALDVTQTEPLDKKSPL